MHIVECFWSANGAKKMRSLQMSMVIVVMTMAVTMGMRMMTNDLFEKNLWETAL